MATPAVPVSPLLLSRTLGPGDYAQLQDELAIVGAHYKHTMHPHRHWEYALALHAITRFNQAQPGRRWRAPVYDLGGANGPFWRMLHADDEAVLVADPMEGGVELKTTPGMPLASIVTALSVIQRVPDQEAFLYYASCLLAPGGLLVLTFDYWNRCGADTARDHTLRQRIYCPKLYAGLRQQAAAFQLTAFGGVDPTWHGAHVHDYSYASLVLEKRR